MNPAARLVAAILAALMLVGAFFFGMVVLIVLAGAFFLSMLFLYLRALWSGRTMAAGKTTEQGGHVIDAEYKVVSRRRD